MSTPAYDLSRLEFYSACLHYIRLCFAEAVDMNKKAINVNLSASKSLQLFCELMSRDPAPLLDYIHSGALKRIVLVGNGKHSRFEWSNEYYRDARPAGIQ